MRRAELIFPSITRQKSPGRLASKDAAFVAVAPQCMNQTPLQLAGGRRNRRIIVNDFRVSE